MWNPIAVVIVIVFVDAVVLAAGAVATASPAVIASSCGSLAQSSVPVWSISAFFGVWCLKIRKRRRLRTATRTMPLIMPHVLRYCTRGVGFSGGWFQRLLFA